MNLLNKLSDLEKELGLSTYQVKIRITGKRLIVDEDKTTKPIELEIEIEKEQNGYYLTPVAIIYFDPSTFIGPVFYEHSINDRHIVIISDLPEVKDIHRKILSIKSLNNKEGIILKSEEEVEDFIKEFMKEKDKIEESIWENYIEKYNLPLNLI